MAKKYLSTKSELGHRFLNAMWIAGFIAVVQIVAVAMAVVKRSPGPIVQTGDNSPGAPAIQTPPPDAGEFIDPNSISPPKPPPISEENENGKGSRPVTRLAIPDLSRAIKSVEPIEDTLVERLVSTGVELRTGGNLQGALQALRDAETNLPDHPRILGELAITMTRLGKNREAVDYWKKLSEMSEAKGGDFPAIASKVLKGEPVPSPLRPGQILQLGEIRVVKKPPARDGEWIHLFIPIKADPASRPLGREMTLRVFCYDRVNGEQTEQTTAKINYEYPTMPWDWKEGVEEIEVIYFQPALTVEQKREFGERVFAGYVIELDYRNQLQDVAASSTQLRNLRFEQIKRTREVLEAPPVEGPDGSLFPSNP